MLSGGLAVSSARVAASESDSESLDRYAGTYAYSAAMKLEISREGDVLLVDRANGRPPGHLLPRKEQGLFSLREADFEVKFMEDDAGRVTGLELRAISGSVRRMRRLVDTSETASAVKAVAVHAETSVNAQVFGGYQRVKGPDGRYRPEFYAFAEGGYQDSSPVAEKSIERITFEEIVRVLAPAMAAQNYVAATDPETTDLAVLVYWGATTTDRHPAVLAEDALPGFGHAARERQNRISARLLGFQEALNDLPVVPPTFSSSRRMDLIEDLEESRYWVALVAIDFQVARSQKVVKPLWSIRYNMRSRGTQFDLALSHMTRFASHYFGQDSAGLVNRWTSNRSGKVEIGEAEVVEFDFTDLTEEETEPEETVPVKPPAP